MSRCYICMKVLPSKMLNPVGLCESCIAPDIVNVKKEVVNVNTDQKEKPREVLKRKKKKNVVKVSSV